MNGNIMINKTLFFAVLTSALVGGCNSTVATNEPLVEITENVPKPKYEEFVFANSALPISQIIDIDGNKIELSKGKNKKLVILFATWCSDSNRALKALNNSDILQDPNIDVIAIAREETKETVSKWRALNNISVPLAVDPDRSIFKQFAAAGIPRMITVENGRIIAMNLAEGENQLDQIVW